MRLLMKPEWEDQYVRYKLYKNLLKNKDDDRMLFPHSPIAVRSYCAPLTVVHLQSRPLVARRVSAIRRQQRAWTNFRKELVASPCRRR
jgi:hypothetical protein